MTSEVDIDAIRKKALEQIEKREKNLKLGIIGIALYEFTLLLLFIFFANWSDKLHQLLFISTLLIYGTLGLGIVALGSFLNINTARVLKAIETINLG
ncbi:MAG: hypothetical protein NTX65_09470 [Ignavibacteriales bacterium]|nr:hypothetical protein [Ignavibacteriales bacterium]